MKRIAIAAFAVFAVCAILFSIGRPLHAGPPPQDVTVVNGAGSPVPVAVGGPVSVNGTVSVAGPINVTGIAAPVNVNGTVRTLPGNNPTPVGRIGILGASVGERQVRQTIYTVPAGKRLFIESETALTIASTGLKAQVTVSAPNFYTLLPQADRGWFDGQGEMFEGSSSVAMIADAGQNVDVQAWLSAEPVPFTGVRVEVGFSGYLVDVP